MKQQTPEWFNARHGKVTASHFADVMAKPGTLRHRDYMMQIVYDLEGIPDHKENAPWFRDGKQYEPEARGAYSWRNNVDIIEVGFVIHAKFPFIGCSPDGLVADDGGIEIKYRKTMATFRKAQKRGYGPPLRPQIQGGLWVTDRVWWDYVQFHVNEQAHIERLDRVRVFRDEEYIRELELRCVEFWREVCKQYHQRNGRWPANKVV